MNLHLPSVYIFIGAIVAGHFVKGNLDEVLRNYDTMHHSHLKHHIVKRDAESIHPQVRQVEFSALGRNFHLFLRRKKGILSTGFKLIAVKGDNSEREIKLDLDAVYEGYLLDEPETSRVSAVWEDGDDLIADIHTKDDLYTVEPSWRHLPKSKNHTMIVYKASDVDHDNNLGKSYCGFIHDGHDEASYDASADKGNKWLQDEKEQAVREKRQAEAQAYSYSPQKDTCHLLLVADYRFFREMGQDSFLKTSSYLISLIDRVDAIYRKTDFGHGYNGVGFEIKEMRIHETPTESVGQHYNQEQHHSWETRSLLEEFGRYKAGADYSTYCLAHLFTAQDFKGNVLGLSYIAEPVRNSPGGICSPVYYKGGQPLYLNTGWSSSQNHHKRRLLTQEADLVTTHGHNWGSEHDPDTDECSKSAFNGGKYIMYTYSVSGYDPNNKYFSPCSKRSIGAVLRAKASGCFKERNKAFCGNYLIEEGEECDEGPQPEVLDEKTRCCTSDCRLKIGAQCSAKNHDCCYTNCTIKKKDDPCYEEGLEAEASCKLPAKCPGNSYNCSEPENARNGKVCLKDSKAKCFDGKCIPFCESTRSGLQSCICDDLANNCKFCCRDPEANNTCAPYMGEDGRDQSMSLPDGMPCLRGYCSKGECHKQVQDLVERFFSVIEDISPDRIVEFMRANIVGTIIVLSLFIWIPASCVISFIDRRRRREEEEYLEWLRSDNQTLVLKKDQDKVKTINKTLQRRHPGTGSVIRQSMPTHSGTYI